MLTSATRRTSFIIVSRRSTPPSACTRAAASRTAAGTPSGCCDTWSEAGRLSSLSRLLRGPGVNEPLAGRSSTREREREHAQRGCRIEVLGRERHLVVEPAALAVLPQVEHLADLARDERREEGVAQVRERVGELGREGRACEGGGRDGEERGGRGRRREVDEVVVPAGGERARRQLFASSDRWGAEGVPSAHLVARARVSATIFCKLCVGRRVRRHVSSFLGSSSTAGQRALDAP